MKLPLYLFFLYSHTEVSGLYYQKIWFMKLISVLILIAILGNSFCNINLQNYCKAVFRVSGAGKNSNIICTIFSPLYALFCNYYSLFQVCLVWLSKSLCTEKTSWMLCIKLLLLRSLCHRKNIKAINVSVYFAPKCCLRESGISTSNMSDCTQQMPRFRPNAFLKDTVIRIVGWEQSGLL